MDAQERLEEMKGLVEENDLVLRINGTLHLWKLNDIARNGKDLVLGVEHLARSDADGR
jgi:hypothetical protein